METIGNRQHQQGLLITERLGLARAHQGSSALVPKAAAQRRCHRPEAPINDQPITEVTNAEDAVIAEYRLVRDRIKEIKGGGGGDEKPKRPKPRGGSAAKELAELVMRFRIPLLGISQGWTYVPLIVCGWLIVLFSIEQVLQDVLRRDAPEKRGVKAAFLE